MILLSVASAVSYGVADFVGGVASRRAHVLRVVAVSAPASLGVELILLPFLGAQWNASAIGWGALSGVASALAFTLLYRTLAIGPMTVLAPVTALVSGVLPVVVGVSTGDRLSISAIVGIPLALCAVVLIATNGPSGGGGRPAPHAVLLACGAGAAIAGQLITLEQAPHDSGLAPLVTGRVVSSALLLSAAVVQRHSLGDSRPPLLAAAAAGCLDSLANTFFLFAARAGNLSISAVIVALYPAATVLLARFVLRERINGIQRVSLVTAAVAVALLARP
ncbi:MAG: EamA family transporter [Pseudonocardiaceae bacterium]